MLNYVNYVNQERFKIYGREITLFLVNGTADSIITAGLANWNGEAVKVPEQTQGALLVREDLRS